MKEDLITIKTMSDGSLEQFANCPYKFYRQFITRSAGNDLNWQQVVQFMINQIVKDYYEMAPKHRSTYRILTLIDKYKSEIDLNLFQSRSHFYSVLAVVSDYLIQLLEKEKNIDLLM